METETFNFAKEECWHDIARTVATTPALDGMDRDKFTVRAREILEEIWRDPPNFSESLEGLQATSGNEKLFACLSHTQAEWDYAITRNVAEICANAVVMILNAEIAAELARKLWADD